MHAIQNNMSFIPPTQTPRVIYLGPSKRASWIGARALSPSLIFVIVPAFVEMCLESEWV